MKALYIFSGERKGKWNGKPGVDYPDTQLYGMNHLPTYGVSSEYKEFDDVPFGRYLKNIFGFRLRHSLMFFISLKYDVVFGISVLYLLIWKKIIPTKTKYIIFNSNLNRLLQVHKEGSFSRKVIVSMLREVDGIVFLSHDHAQRLIHSLPFLEKRSYVVHMGVDKYFYSPTFEGREDFFLSVGRDNARDYETLVKVARERPEFTFHFVCLPRNVNGITDIPHNVIIHHNISLQELENLYKRARALLLIMHDDSYLEGSDSSGPTVLLEAMAIGLPIVVSNKGYIKEYIHDGVDGLIVPFYDTDAIIHALSRLSNESFRNDVALHARAKVDSTLNTNIMAKQLAEVFQKIHG